MAVFTFTRSQPGFLPPAGGIAGGSIHRYQGTVPMPSQLHVRKLTRAIRIGCCLGLIASAPAWAQDPAPAEAADPAKTLETIVVTAGKLKESVREIAGSVSAVTDQQLQDLGAQSLADPGARLTGELRDFGVVAASNEAVVTYDAALVRADGKTVEKRRFAARVPVASITPVPVASALEQAANQVAGEVADWVGK